MMKLCNYYPDNVYHVCSFELNNGKVYPFRNPQEDLLKFISSKIERGIGDLSRVEEPCGHTTGLHLMRLFYPFTMN
jgi:hypothetical protein